MKTKSTFSLPLQWICNQRSFFKNGRKNKFSAFLFLLISMLALPFLQTKADTSFTKESITPTLNAGYISFKVLGMETDGTDDELDDIWLYYLDPKSGTWVMFFNGDMDNGDEWQKNTEIGDFPLVVLQSAKSSGTKKYGYLNFYFPRNLFQGNILIKAEVDWDLDSDQVNSGKDFTFYYNVADVNDVPWNTFWNTSYDATKNTLSFSFENCELYAQGIDKVVDPEFPEEYKTRDELDSMAIEYLHPITNKWVKVITGNCYKNFTDTLFNLVEKTTDGTITATSKLSADRKYTYITNIVWDKIPQHLWGKKVQFRYNIDWDLDADGIRAGIDQTNTFYITFNTPRNPVIQSSGCVYSAENQEVVLKWEDSNASTIPEITYFIKRKLKSASTYEFITPTEGIKNKQFIDKNFMNWKEYEYKIYAIPTSWGWTKDELLDDYSITYTVSTNPKIPQFENFKLTAFPTKVSTKPYIKINWENEWLKENSLKLYHRESDEPEFTLLETLTPGTTSYTDAYEIEDNSKHFYKLVVDIFGVIKEKIDSITVEKLVTFKNVAASKNTIGDRIQLSWEIDDLDLCDRFEIYRSFTSDSLGMDVKTKPEMVHQLSAQTLLNKWDDLTAVAGVVYEYEIYAYNEGGDGQIRLAKSNSDIGFRTPVGTISGRITYGGGTAVDKVSVYVQSSTLDDNMLYKSLLLKGENSQKSQVNLTNAKHGCIKNGFSFQSWITSSRPVKYTPIIELSNEYSIGIRNDSVFAFIGAFNLAKPSLKCKLDSAIQLNNFFHLSVTLDTRDSVKIYLNGKQRAKAVLAVSASTHVCTFNESDKIDGTLVTPKTKCYIGNKTDETLTTVSAYSGNVDDIRLWSRNLTATEIESNFNRYLSGTESGLIGYWPLDEGINSYAFDCSKANQKYNEHHIKLVNSYTSANVPGKEQLAIKGVTDSDGNYIIRGVPFTGEGSTYAIKPVLGTHKFEPSQLMRYISPSSLIHNSSDFTDKSSFPVKMTVVYKNTNYPVEGVSFSIDSNPFSKENKLVVTNELGVANIDLPIGEHYINASLVGHVFRHNGRYPSLGKIIVNEKIKEIEFVDTTLVSITGRVAGGLVEAAKPVGFKKGDANIGSAIIRLKPSEYPDYSLNNTGVKGSSRTLDADAKGNIKSVSTIPNADETYVEITTDSVNGEYYVMLPPIKEWTVASVSIKPKGIVQQLSDYNKSIRVSPLVTAYDTCTVDKKLDTLHYNVKQNFIYRVDPTIIVSDSKAKTGAFGDSIYVIKNANPALNDTIPLYTVSNGVAEYVLGHSAVGEVEYPKGKPVFTMGSIYDLNIQAYEEYINHKNKITKVPLAGATVTIDNEMGKLFRPQNSTAANVEIPKHEMTLNSKGFAFYRFLVGFPDITTPENGMSLNVSINYNNTQTKWENNDKFRGIVLGYEPVAGANFKTRGPGPLVPLVVLRDPPGSKSYAYMEKGTEIKYSMSHKHTLAGGFSVENKLKFGTVFETSIGIGFMVTTKIKAEDDLTIGLEGEYSSFTGEVNENKLSLKERIQTSAAPDFVGSMADVYIGTSTNVFTTDCNFVELAKENGAVKLVKPVRETSDLQTDTEFRLSQYEIVTAQIPAWKKTIANLFLNTDASNNLYKPLNNLSVKQIIESMGKDKSGNLLYEITYGSKGYGDQVDSAFNQIKNWQDLIKRNEMAKFNAKTSKVFEKSNISFDAGTYIDRSYMFSTKTGTTNGSSSKTQESISNELGIEINGFGMEITTEQKFGGGREDESSSTTENSTSFGYVLSDPDTDNRFSVNVYKNKFLSSELKDLESEDLDAEEADATVGSYIFELAAGQTSCPYESADTTLYYRGHTTQKVNGKNVFKAYTDTPTLPFKPLSVGSQALDVPKMDILSGNEKVNIPNGKEASFTLLLKSGSTGYSPRPYILSVDESSNTDGAIISVDGSPLTEPRTFYIKKEEPLTKILTVRQSKVDVLEYDSLKLRFSSACNDVTDSKFITVKFVPSCSDLNLIIDSLTMNTKTGNSVLLKLRNFDQAYTNFKGMKIQYKLEGEKDWKEKLFAKDTMYFKNKNLDIDSVIPKDVSAMDYRLILKGFNDGRYQVRAMTICSDPTSSTPINNITPEFVLVKDMALPATLGIPSPSNGILTPEDEISVTFNESLQTNRMVNVDFEVEGVLNGAELQHSEGLSFDTIETSNAFTEIPISLQNSSFAIEAWVKMTETAALGTIFSIGEGENKLSLKMNKTSVALFVNDIQVDSVENIHEKNDWQYVSLNYDAYNQNTALYVLSSDAQQTKLVRHLSKSINPDGRLTVGSGFKGKMHQLVVWNVNRSISDLTDMNYAKTGVENNIVGYWPMDEAYGKTAVDKVRGRNLIVASSWFLDPSGNSAVFAGNSSVAINTATIPIASVDNFTLEFWFSGSTQKNATLFSCGKGTDDVDLNNKLSIGFNDKGALSLSTKRVSYVIADSAVSDANWHHFAMSVSRNANANVYVDGKLKVQIPATKISGLASAKMTIGSRSYSSNSTLEQDQYFKGKIDEFRIWNSALSSENIRLDMRSAVEGTSAGLIAYYPFDEIMDNSFVDASSTKAPNAQATNVELSDLNPGIKMVRKKEKLNFSYAASENKIIFTINEPLKKIENCILEFAVNKVFDLNGNTMISPIKWTAFVNNNRLKWETDQISITKEVLAPAVFSASVINKSGKYENFVIDGLPNWLSVNKSSGRLNPLEKMELNFTIDNSVNIGSYESSLILTGNNGIQEMLPVSLKVTGTRPDWTVNPYDFESSMNVIGSIAIEGVSQEDSGDMLAAFIGNKCVGVVNPGFDKSLNSYILYMDVYGNAEDANKQLKFSLWDAGTGRIYPDVDVKIKDKTELLKFTSGGIIGKVDSAAVFNATDKVEQQLNIRTGWNWISTNVVNSSPSLFDQLKAGMEADGISLKSKTLYTNYSTTYSIWSGSLRAIDQQSMYLLRSAQPKNLKLIGATAKSSVLPITIASGWNWIGYIPQFVSPLQDALGSVSPVVGDQIKSQVGFATYTTSGWKGSLQYLIPGQGYMYNSKDTKGKALYYPTQYISRSNVKQKSRYDEVMHWQVVSYQQTMIITAIIKIDNVEVRNENLEVGAFVDNICRGTIKLIYEPIIDKYVCYSNVQGDPFADSNKKITFKCYNSDNGKELESADKSIAFVAQTDIGSFENPYVINFSSVTTGQYDLVNNNKIIYPNPVVNTLNFSYNPQGVERLEVVDCTGRTQVLSTAINTNSINVNDLTPGIYTLRVNYKGTIHSHRFIKK